MLYQRVKVILVLGRYLLALSLDRLILAGLRVHIVFHYQVLLNAELILDRGKLLCG
jgi:hypothetical protein